MATVFRYNNNNIHTTESTETITLLTKNLYMNSDVLISVDELSTLTVLYNGSTILNEVEEGEYTLTCANKMMSGNITAVVTVRASGYTQVMTVTSSGTITLPNSSNIKVVLIGGGTGGAGGSHGTSGTKATKTSTQTGTTYSLVTWDTDTYTTSDTVSYSVLYKTATVNSSGTIDFSDKAPASPQVWNMYAAFQAGFKYIKQTTTTCIQLTGIVSGSGYTMYYKQVQSTATYSYSASYSSTTSGGLGGLAGTAGSGGKIYSTELTITPSSSATVSIGAGGAGGAASTRANALANGVTPGSAGTDSTITIGGTTYSSSSGNSSSVGYTDDINNVTYAVPGDPGQVGGNGGSYSGTSSPSAGSNVTYYIHGIAASSYYGGTVSISGTYGASGSGGGAAVGGSAGNGGTATSSTTGAGGAGANATTPTNVSRTRGTGGNGGNGGGGGGNAGGRATTTTNFSVGSAGSYGTGSAGQDGADGIVLIFY